MKYSNIDIKLLLFCKIAGLPYHSGLLPGYQQSQIQFLNFTQTKSLIESLKELSKRCGQNFENFMTENNYISFDKYLSIKQELIADGDFEREVKRFNISTQIGGLTGESKDLIIPMLLKLKFGQIDAYK